MSQFYLHVWCAHDESSSNASVWKYGAKWRPSPGVREVLAIRNATGLPMSVGQRTQQLHDAHVSQEEAWEAQLLLNMLGHRAWTHHKRGQCFTDVLFE